MVKWRMTNWRAATNPDGYTLLEVVLALALVVVLTAVLWPTLSAITRGAALDRAADQMRAELTRVRLRAMEEGRPFQMTLVTDSGQFQVGEASTAVANDNSPMSNRAGSGANTNSANSESLTLDENVKFRAIATQAPGGANTSGPVILTFRPDGTTDDVEFEIVDADGAFARVRVRGITGGVAITAPRTSSSTNAPPSNNTPANSNRPTY